MSRGRMTMRENTSVMGTEEVEKDLEAIRCEIG